MCDPHAAFYEFLATIGGDELSVRMLCNWMVELLLHRHPSREGLALDWPRGEAGKQSAAVGSALFVQLLRGLLGDDTVLSTSNPSLRHRGGGRVLHVDERFTRRVSVQRVSYPDGPTVVRMLEMLHHLRQLPPSLRPHLLVTGSCLPASPSNDLVRIGCPALPTIEAAGAYVARFCMLLAHDGAMRAFAAHLRARARWAQVRPWVLAVCRLLRLHRRAAERTYAPGGRGADEVRRSFGAHQTAIANCSPGWVAP